MRSDDFQIRFSDDERVPDNLLLVILYKKNRLHCHYDLKFNDEKPDCIKYLFTVVSIVHRTQYGGFPN